MKKAPTTKARGGRPRSPANTELIAALIGRQDQLTHRRRGQLAELRAQYLDASLVAAERIEARRILLERMLLIPRAVAPAIAATSDPGAVFGILDEAFREALGDVADRLDRSAAAMGDESPVLSPLRPSRSLAQARARAASASTELAHFRDRIRASSGRNS